MVRFKHRYLLVHLVFPEQLPADAASTSTSTLPSSASPPPVVTESRLISLLRDSLSVNFGDVGAGEVGGTFSVKYLSPTTSTVILRVAREHYRTLWAALTLLRKVDNHECIARVLHVSGTIRKTQHSAIAHDRAQILLRASAARQQRRLHRSRRANSVVAAGAGGGEGRAGVQSRLKAAEEDDDDGGEEEEEEVKRLLSESRDRIEAMEA